MQVLQLRAEYLSDVAPDRKMLYQQAKNAMKNQNNNPKCRGIGELTLLDFLEAADGRGSSLGEELSELPDYLEEKPSFDMKA